MIAAFCRWLADRRPCRLIDVQGQPYLERYWLCGLPGGGALYLHRFLAPDDARGLHDHPWPWALSLVLVGGYDELRGDPWLVSSCRTVRPGRINLILGSTWHRIAALRGREAWTLFAHGPKTKRWGFAIPIGPIGAARGDGLTAETVMARIAFDQPGQAWGWWRTAAKGRDARRERRWPG